VASIGGVNNDGGGSNFALATDAEGKIYTSAWVRWAIDFDPGPDELILPESDAFELFLSRMQEVPVGTIPAAGIIPVQVWPNPGSGPLFLDYRQEGHSAYFRILDVAGRVAMEGRLLPGAVQTLELPVGEGIWFLHLRDDQGRQQIQRIVRSVR
jgi:hypothetical protein